MSSTEANDERTLAALARATDEFAVAREWGQFHDPKNLAMALASEVGELVSVLRWVRSEESDAFLAGGEQRDRFEAELADVGICLLLLCSRVDIDLHDAIIAKLGRNAVKYPLERSRGRAEPPSP
jgi:dCTP diphosphatase